MSSKLVTRDDIQQGVRGGRFYVPQGRILTPLAEEYISTEKIEVIRGPDISLDDYLSDDSVVEKVTSEVLRHIGHATPEHIKSVIEESLVDGDRTDLATRIQNVNARVHTQGDADRAIITSSGADRPGIVSSIAEVIAEFSLNIEDISQTLIGQFFTMIIVVNLSPLATSKYSFLEFRNKIIETSQKLGFETMVMHERVLNVMHRI